MYGSGRKANTVIDGETNQVLDSLAEGAGRMGGGYGLMRALGCS